jgi:hypothetical protein
MGDWFKSSQCLQTPTTRGSDNFYRGACYATTLIDTEVSEHSTTTSTRTATAAQPGHGTGGTNQERINALAREILGDGNSSESHDEDASHL